MDQNRSRRFEYENYPGGHLFTPFQSGLPRPGSATRASPGGRPGASAGDWDVGTPFAARGPQSGGAAGTRDGTMAVGPLTPAAAVQAGLPAHSLLDAFGAMAPAHAAAQPSALFSPSLDVSNAFDESTRLQNVSAVGAAAAGPASCWVTVFGFGPALTAAVIEELLSCGQIVSHHTEGSNWVKVQFETPVGAQRALARDGTVLDRAGVMIGVRRTLPPRGEGGGRDGGLSSSSNVSMSVATPSRNALLLAQQRSVYSIAPVKTPFENAPYALTSWWAKVLYYVFGI